MATTWLITGCSSGFGEQLVRQVRSAGDNVIATGRNADSKLAHLQDTGATLLDLDVTADEEIIAAKVHEAWDAFPGGIDVLVNNAGYIQSGALEELTQSDYERSMRTNLYGPLNITRAILPKLRSKGKGTLVYLSSQAAWHADPSASAYCASKFALAGAVESIAKELALFAPGIKVLLIEPGYFRTSVFENLDHIDANVPDYALFNAGVRQVEASLTAAAPGDPALAVTRMIELVKGTGMAEGREVPIRVPLGLDGWERVKTKCEETLKICEDWKDVAASTDFTK